MAGKLHRLTAKEVLAAKEPGRYADGGNLYLQVSPTGARSWLFMYRLAGRQREMGLGSAAAHAVSLQEARNRAAAARKQVEAKIDPLDARRAAEAAAKAHSITFGAFADEYVSSHKPGWRNEKHAAQWEMTLGEAYCASIRGRPIGSIGVDDVLGILSPIWQKVPETARRVRMRIERVLDAANVKGLRSGDNPARWRGHLDHLLPKHPRSSKGHHGALAFQKMPQFMASLGQLNSISARALEFLVLTSTRTGEAIGATWNEINFKDKIWTIPAERMKAGREHRIPLSTAAIKVLEAVKGKDALWVFPGLMPDKPLSNMAMLMLLKGMGYDETVHGFRSTFTDWASECTSFPSEVIKMAKAHAIEDKTEAAYRRGDLFEKRRKLMEAWGSFVTTQQSGTVVQIKNGNAS
jgi:integrase